MTSLCTSWKCRGRVQNVIFSKSACQEYSDIAKYYISPLTRVDIKNYTALDKYTAPADGYVMFQGSTSSETTLNLDSIGLISSTTASGRNAIFVKKNMTIHFEGAAVSYAYFYPLA